MPSTSACCSVTNAAAATKVRETHARAHGVGACVARLWKGNTQGVEGRGEAGIQGVSVEGSKRERAEGLAGWDCAEKH
eukprot:6212724-Pleurochrysis_carterae.AAC.2